MADVTLEVGIDQQDLRQSVRRTERTLQQMERRLSRRRARNRLRRIREERRTEQRITREREREERNRQRMERRLSRRRARNRLRQIRERQRLELRAQREEERQRQRRADRRKRIAKGAVGTGGRAIAVGGGALVAGTVAAVSAQDVLEFQRSLAILAGQADITREAQAKLAETFEIVSLKTGKSAKDILSGFEAVIEKSGDFQLAEDVLLNMTKASVGLGADMQDLGYLAAALGSAFGASGKEVSRFFEQLAAQGDMGQVTLKDLAQIGEEVFTTAAGAGFKGKGVVTSVGALIQAGIGSADERKTAINNLLKLLASDAKKIEQKLGIKVKENGEFRDPAMIVKDIISKTKGDVGKIKAAGFSDLSPFLATASQFRETGGFGKLDQFLQAGAGSAGLIEKRFTRVEQTAPVVVLDKLTQLMAAMGGKGLAPALLAFTETIDKMLENKQLIDDLTLGLQTLGEALGLLVRSVAYLTTDLLSIVGKVRRFLGFGGDEKPPATPTSKAVPLGTRGTKTTNGQATSPQNVKLNVENKVTVDDRGNVKKSKTRVDMQNNSNVGRTLGTVGQ